MILLISSKKDVASLNIKEQILENFDFIKIDQTFEDSPIYTSDVNGKKVDLITLNGESIYAKDLQTKFPECNLAVFISRHSSQSGKPTLSVHAPGNFGEAELGGTSRTLSVAPATAMQIALKALFHYKEQLRLDYEVSYECTHHGPSLNFPTMFVELGSSLEQWEDSTAAQAVANAALTSIANFETLSNNAVLGIGGTHYNQQFTLMALMGAATFGHMIPKYAISLIDSDMIKQCIQKTLEKVTLATLDWKGIKSEDKPGLLSVLESTGLPYNKI